MQFLASLAITLTLGFSMLQCSKIDLANTKTDNKNTTNSAVHAPGAQTGDEAPRIALADAKKDFDDNAAIFVDTRPASSYNDEHIKGAINISADMFDEHYKELPKNRKIIAYCS